MNIDITTTAVIRPLIFERTLSSFRENVFTDRVLRKCNCRIIINVDKIGEEEYHGRGDVLNIAYKYFDNVIYNLPDEPGFSKALIWCWKNTTAEYVFNLEEDWIALNPINLGEMIKILNNYENLVSLRLNKESLEKKYDDNLKLIYHEKLSLNPTLFKGEFIRGVVKLMDEELNPEKQLRISDTPRGKYLEKFTHGIYTNKKLVEDIGREWMEKSNFVKEIGFKYWKRR